jgi:hypothetical protein
MKPAAVHSMHQYELRPRKDNAGIDQFHFAGYDVRTVLDCLDCYLSHNGNSRAPNPKSQAREKRKFSSFKTKTLRNLGSACVPRAGERVLAIANFGLMFLTLADYRASWKARFGVTPKPDTRDACATRNSCARRVTTGLCAS